MDFSARLPTRRTVFPNLALFRLEVLKTAYQNGTVLTLHLGNGSVPMAIFRCSFATPAAPACPYGVEAISETLGGRTYTVKRVIEVHSAGCRNGLDEETRKANQWVIKQAIEELERQESHEHEGHHSIGKNASSIGAGMQDEQPASSSKSQNPPDPAIGLSILPSSSAPSSNSCSALFSLPRAPQPTSTPTSSPPPFFPSSSKSFSLRNTISSALEAQPLSLPSGTIRLPAPTSPNPDSSFAPRLPAFIIGTLPSLSSSEVTLMADALQDAGVSSMELPVDLLIIDGYTAGPKKQEEDVEMAMGENEVSSAVERGIRKLREACERDSRA